MFGVLHRMIFMMERLVIHSVNLWAIIVPIYLLIYISLQLIGSIYLYN